MKLNDLTGKRFGRWQVLSRAKNRGPGVAYWNCVCDCGTKREVHGGSLRRGLSTSCGCSEGFNNKKHERSRTPEYKAYYNMINRCEYEKGVAYGYYGARGIKVCDAWRDSFEAFFKDMGLRPSAKHSLDRIDPDGDYCPSNCRWADKATQAWNTRVSKNSTTGVTGVTRRGKRFLAQICVNYKAIHLGEFDSLEKAKEARKEAERKYGRR